MVCLFVVNLESHKHDEYHVDETELKNVTMGGMLSY